MLNISGILTNVLSFQKLCFWIFFKNLLFQVISYRLVTCDYISYFYKHYILTYSIIQYLTISVSAVLSLML